MQFLGLQVNCIARWFDDLYMPFHKLDAVSGVDLAKQLSKPAKRRKTSTKASTKNTGRAARAGRSKAAKGDVPEVVLADTDIRSVSFFKRLSKGLFRKLVLVAFVLATIPILLTLAYWPKFVHPVSTLMVGNWIGGEKVHRQWVDFEDVAPVLWQSVMMSEDGQFCRHNGVDWNQMNLVIDDALEGEKVRGASTLPMQTVKNLYLWSSRSYVRKILEVPLALLVDLVWSKKRIMEIYLNIAEWGPGIYGIEAAARHHFKRSAKKLNRRQAALLAVTLPNPKLRNPRKPNRGMRRLAKLVERRARASGAYIKCLR